MKDAEDLATKRTRKRAKTNSLASRIFSINCIAVVFSVVGVIFFVAAGFFFVSIFSRFEVYAVIASMTILSRVGMALISGFLGVGSLWIGNGLRQMNKMAAMFALLYCLLFFSFTLIIYAHPFDYLLPQPLYLNFIWLWPVPIAIPITIWRNWKNMRWREGNIFGFGDLIKKEKQPEESTE